METYVTCWAQEAVNGRRAKCAVSSRPREFFFFVAKNESFKVATRELVLKETEVWRWIECGPWDINHLTSAWRKQWNYFDDLVLVFFFPPKRLWLLIRKTYSAEMLFHSQSRCVLRFLIRYQVNTGPVSPIPKLTCIPFYCQTYDHRCFCGFSLELFC